VIVSIEALFGAELKVINIGLESFRDTLLRVGVEVRQVEPDDAEQTDAEQTKEQKP
jgi:hypothetical protein